MMLDLAEWDALHIKLALEAHVEKLEALLTKLKTNGANTAAEALQKELAHLRTVTMKGVDPQLELMMRAADGTDRSPGARKKGGES